MSREFLELASLQWSTGNSLCVGLDPDLERLPDSARGATVRERLLAFLAPIIDATADIAGFYKPNSAFFEAYGAEGFEALADTCAHIRAAAPQCPIILDAKRGDIGTTNEGYVRMAFDVLGVDAITVHPYLGGEALQPFLDRREKGVIVLAKTSNHGSGEFQDREVDGEPLYARVARHVATEWNRNGNCGLVVGSTYPRELAHVRAIVGRMPILMPGVGAQGADVAASVKAGRNGDGSGMIINSSRGILYASSGTDFADAARQQAQELHGAIAAALLE